MLELSHVSVVAPSGPLFAPVSLRVEPGAVATIMGPSGAGKSSLLAYLAGVLEPPLFGQGKLLLDQEEVSGLPAQDRRVGLLFQDDLLFEHLTIAENLAFGLPPRLEKAERRARVTQALEEAELQGFGPRLPASLSGGQRARAALMRCLLADPKALLLDEPFAKLDLALRGRFREFVWHHLRTRGLPGLLVSHDPADADSAQGLLYELQPAAQGS